ncbi:alpha-2-macroglobulin [Ixodes scapularis]|uniref:alpha-2-macroglobulin n=1 Tax=Ixodes scapularis TaxID=6945 RepID=UPI001C38DE2C|nr:alpha-2-macroglobulin [Ixodes scapularis]
MLRCGLLLAALCSSVLWHRVATADKPAFLLTAPHALIPGATETLALNVLNPPKDGHATIQLLAPSGQVLSETSIKSAGGFPQTVSLNVPKELPVGSSLAAIGKFGRYSFDKRLSVKVADGSAGLIIIIQTDKPVYRAGEVVRLRILSIDHRKLPLAKDAIGDVWVENANHFRVAQWHNVSFSRGVLQLEMELSKEPPLGQWKIFCRLLGRETRKPFQVDEYVLPKFGVEVVPPPYVFPEETNTTWKICAQYVYGKPVKGQLRAQLTYGRFHWASEATKVLPSIDLDLPIKGCHEFTLNGRDLLLANEDLNRRPLILTAEVTEEATGVTQHANVTVRLSWSRLTLEFLKDGAVADFKPGLPHRGALMVTQPDGTPAPGESVNICFLAVNVTMREVSKGCRDFKSGPDGLVRFSVPGLRSSPSSLRVTAKAEGGSLNPPTTTVLLQPWRSLSQRYLRVLAPGQKLKCGVSTPVRFHYTKLKNHSSVAFNYQVFSGRRVVEQGRFEPRVSQDDTDDRIPVESGLQSGGFITAELSLEPKPEWGLSSKARLLLYYAHPKGELIGDSRRLQVEPCTSNPVSMHFAKDSAYPGTTVELSLSAASGSLCGVWALDRGLLHKDSSAQLTADKLEQLLEPLEPKPDPSAFSSSHCRDRGRVFEALRRDRYLREPLSFLDATAAFEESAVQVLTDLKLDIHDCDLVEDDFWRSAFREFSTDVVSHHHGFDRTEFEPRANEPRVVLPEEDVPADPPKSAVSLRTHFPETWLWEMHNVDREGSVQFQRELPHSVTQWQAGALCLHPTRGVGLSNAALDALQPFFAQLTLPAVAKRGELVPVTATLFSYLQACVPVKLSLNADSACMKLLGEPQKRDCLCGNESIVLRVQVRPLCLGAINITLHALGLAENKGLCDEGKPLETRQARDSLRKSLLVTAEGQPQEKSTAKYICLNGSGEGPQKHEFPLELPRNVVSGSSRGVFTLSGNVGSPVSVDRLDKLVRLPTGCGEQNLALLAPNVFVLDYLNSSGERGHPLESKLKENIAKGYQRQLNYRHAEGGYSAFGSQDPEPSLWLTAFAVRTFGRSRRFMPVDEAELSGSIRWILSNQYDNGCFPSVGRVLNSRLKGGLEGHSLAPLTAYVLISLLEAGAEIPQVSRVGAVRCLLQELQQQQQDSHTMALAAYAFSLFEDSKASELLASLRDEAQPGNGTEATLHWHKNVSTAVAVETASYVVLASLKLGGRAAAKSVLPVVRWVLEQRNHDGGFVSTQDTVVALQALAEYAKATSSSDTRLQIRVSSEGLGSTLTVNRENALLKQELFLPVVPTVLHIEATGTGCAFIQATVKYNVPAAEETKSFGFWVTALHANCRPQVKVCASYLVSWAMSGMVIVQVKMQSGYRFEKLSGSPQVKRHEVDQDQVNLYFEELSNRKSCALLELVQDYVVENAVPATVTLQDYYEPGVTAVKNYTIPPCLLDDNGTSEDLQEMLIQSESVQSSRVAGARFHGFRNVDHDLDFPEGPEANAQVVVPAPPEFEGLRSCPRCHDDFPADFAARYCAAELALRVEASNGSTKKHTLWVSDDLSPPLEKPVTVGRSASYELRGHCSCPTLSKGETFLVLGPSTTMSTDEKNATHLHLARNVDIVHVQDATILETTKLHSVRQRC